MTRYTVVWPQSSLDELAEIWLKSSDRAAVTSAAHQIDQALAEDPGRKGLEVSEGLRALYVEPLRILFVARDDDRIAEVVRVKQR